MLENFNNIAFYIMIYVCLGDASKYTGNCEYFVLLG